MFYLQNECASLQYHREECSGCCLVCKIILQVYKTILQTLRITGNANNDACILTNKQRILFVNDGKFAKGICRFTK